MAEERTTLGQAKQFGEAIVDHVIDWVGSALTPGQVFDSFDISEWCKANSDPEEVFGTARLEEWARENGWEKADG